MTRVFVSLGSNIDKEKYISAGMLALREIDQYCRFSDVYETEAVGFIGPNFYNLVAELNVSLDLMQMMQALRNIEMRFGRQVVTKKNQNRTLDIDLLMFGEQIHEKHPQLPRDDIFKFAFVLRPLAELSPDTPIPGRDITFQEAWEVFKQPQRLWPVPKRFLIKNMDEMILV